MLEKVRVIMPIRTHAQGRKLDNLPQHSVSDFRKSVDHRYNSLPYPLCCLLP